MKIKTKLSKLILFALVAISIFNYSVYAKSNGIITQDQFLSMVKENESYKEYSKYFTSNEPTIIKEIKDKKGGFIGFIGCFSFYKEDSNDSKIKVFSSINFAYDIDSNKISVTITDYSKLMVERKIYLKDLSTNETTIQDTNENIKINDFANMLNEKENSLKELKNVKYNEFKNIQNKKNKDVSQNLLLSNEACYICLEYTTVPTTYDSACCIAQSAACSFLTFPPAIAACLASELITCCVPGYTYCSNGVWSSGNCPTQ